MTAALTGFLGLSHLGIVSSIGWASLGSPVVGVDLEAQPVERLGRGELPVHEPGLPEAFAAAREPDALHHGSRRARGVPAGDRVARRAHGRG